MWTKMLVSIVLFYLLTPGILVSLPPGGSKQAVALTHAVVFAVVSKLVWMTLRKYY
jgi:hypothetical protein